MAAPLPLHHIETTNGFAAALRIVVGAVHVLYVVDVPTFNVNGQIQLIHADLGRGD